MGFPFAGQPNHRHDHEATLLHLLDIDYVRLTTRHAGRGFRLANVADNNTVRVILV